MPETIVFRVDAAPHIGSGHVRRCLSLAEYFKGSATTCLFVVRPAQNDLANDIRSSGFKVQYLPVIDSQPSFDWQEDAIGTLEIVKKLHVSWLIVDHYGIDARWHKVLKPEVGSLMVIDDLANRPYEADLLLDQTYGREMADYRELVPLHCKLLVGSDYALLRQAFNKERSASLARRGAIKKINTVLLTTGGGDDNGFTLGAVKQFVQTPEGQRPSLKVIFSDSSPDYQNLCEICETHPGSVKLLTNVNDMEMHMAECDFAIGSGGTTSWERCCLGLPTALVVLADNQIFVAKALDAVGAARVIEHEMLSTNWILPLIAELNANMEIYWKMVGSASRLCDGRGAERVFVEMEKLSA